MHDHPHEPRRRPPSRGARIAWIILGTMAVTAVCAVSALAIAAHAVMTSPMLRVHVSERGRDAVSFDVAVPGAVIAAGLAVAPHLVPDETWEQVRIDLEAELAELPAGARPALAEMVRHLGAMPDATLVEVEDRDETVRVETHGGELRVSVRAADADVDVTVPLALLEQAAALLEG
jgi:hypothetical protein